jgi:hypothetical protein
MGKKLHKRMNGEEVKIHQHDNYQMPGAYKQDGDKNQNQPMFRTGKPYEMGMSMRGPLDKHGKVFPNSWEEEDVKRGKKQMAEGHYKHGEALFDDAHGSWNWSKSHHSTGTEMKGPLNGNAFGHAMQKAGGDYDKAKAMLKMTGPLNQEGNPNVEKKVKCKPGFKMHRGECVKIGTKVSGWGKMKEVK